ncbi:hypothetical protein Cni_G02575 [Canna indica]|uniref:ABC transporter domain-containing protein n=1 Tax=Canna indica TaxID=4628 RepID=A0AAQ3JPG5_9LILI|nr:hypothetical protein Cni_G02575 [Canna indica]
MEIDLLKGDVNMNEIGFNSKENGHNTKKEEEKGKDNEKELDELSVKLSNSFSKILENKFSKESFLEIGFDSESSRSMEKEGTKPRKGARHNDSTANVPIMLRNAKLKKRRYMTETIALGDEGDLGLMEAHFYGPQFTSTNNMEGQNKICASRISGRVLPDEMLAMLCPSGSSKTTLLTTLSGSIRRIGNNLDGSITYNGLPFSNSLKCNMGFVMQDDVLYPHLTVTETLVYPSLLFPDEPTSGLDSTIAGRIVSTLLNLTKGGKTMVMTIHQPLSRLLYNVYMFHEVLLLSMAILFTLPASAMRPLSSCMNPADFLLDLANGVSTDDSTKKLSSLLTETTCTDKFWIEELSSISKQLKEYEPDKMATNGALLGGSSSKCCCKGT